MDIARKTALDLLHEVLEKRTPFDDAFARLAEPLSSQDRAFARQVTATVLRRLGQIDGLIDACLKKSLPPAQTYVRHVLRLGVAQLLFMNVPDHAAIDTAVDLLDQAKDSRAQGFKGLTNAVLRRLSREGVERRARQDSARLNTPKWLWESWARAYDGKTARTLAEMHLREPPLDLTLKPGQDTSDWAKTLKGEVLPTGSIRLTQAGRIEDLPGYTDGAWWVQDAAAAIPATLLGDVTGKAVVDLCAAPGGKTAQLASAGARVIAVDRSKGRLRRLQDNMRRLRLEAEVVTADGASYQPDVPVDAVLLDAPCSTTGTLRRHPDVARLKSPRDVKTMTQLQRSLFDNAATVLKPGGMLIYCVCSLQPEEGPQQIKRFLSSHTSLKRVAVHADEVSGLQELLTPDGDVRTLPMHLAEQGGMDGFFAARLMKQE